MAAGNQRSERATPATGGRRREVFVAFLKLGLTSFGGPVAHLGYFRDELVLRRRWLDDVTFGELVALCQFLPGPASSQVGFALGLLRGGGLAGGALAWLGFTAPSALLLMACALGAAAVTGPLAEGLLHGLKLVAVAVVAQAVWGMARALTPDGPRAAIVLMAVALVVLLGGALGQVAAIAVGALAGLALCRQGPARAAVALHFPVSRRAGLVALGLFVVLFVGPLVLVQAGGSGAVALFESFYRSGALVFGGGHVVLPLLEAEVVRPDGLGATTFLAGYGLAQAVPGPLFTFAAYLGAAMGPATLPEAGAAAGLCGALIALGAIFLPGLLLVYGMLPFWSALRPLPAAQAAMRGANAAVVGLLGAALYTPVWTSAVLTPRDFAVALAGFLLLTVWQAPPWMVVVLLALTGVGLTTL